MESSKIDICVVDDHHIFRKAVCQLLRTFPRIGEVSDSENGLKCLESVAKLSMYLLSGKRITRELSFRN